MGSYDGAEVCELVGLFLLNKLTDRFGLKEGNYLPYRKPNNNSLYIDSRSNHRPNIIKQLPVLINRRLSSLSSDAKSFESSAPLYQDALDRNKYHAK